MFGDAAAEEVGTPGQVLHVLVVGRLVGDRDCLVVSGFQVRRPHVQRPGVVRTEQVGALQGETGVVGQHLDVLDGR